MDASSILHCGRNLARNSPLAVELELQGAVLVSLHRAGAELCAQVGGRRQCNPLCGAGNWRACLSEDFRLKASCLPLAQAVSQCCVAEQFTEISRRCRIFFPLTLVGIQS